MVMFLVERIVFFLVFRQKNITPFGHGAVYEFCHRRYDWCVITSHHEYELSLSLRVQKIEICLQL